VNAGGVRISITRADDDPSVPASSAASSNSGGVRISITRADDDPSVPASSAASSDSLQQSIDSLPVAAAQPPPAHGHSQFQFQSPPRCIGQLIEIDVRPTALYHPC